MAKGRYVHRPSLPACFSRTRVSVLHLLADKNVRATLCLLGCDRVLRGLGHAELHDRLRLDLDWFAGLRVASHASLAVRLHQASESGHNEYPVLLGLFYRNVTEVLRSEEHT